MLSESEELFMAMNQNTAEAEAFRALAPQPLPPRPLNIPDFGETKLANGLDVVLVEDHRLPLVSFRLAFPSGDANDPPGLPGLSDMMTALLNEGTTSRTSLQIAEQVERLGATLSAGANSDYTTIAASALSVYSDQILELLADIVLNPSFPENEIELTRENAKQMLIQQRAQPNFLASERTASVIFGRHPYSLVSPTPESLDAMTRETLQQFHHSTLAPDRAVMIVVGDVRRDEVIERLNALFGDWQTRTPPAPKFPAPPERPSRSAYVVDRPGSAQSNIVIANLAINRTSPDFFPMLVMNTILGSNASSRLFMNLREEKGYTYGAYSSVDARRDIGTFRASAEVRTAVTGDSLKEFFYELDRIREDEVSEKEITDAKSYLTGVFPLRIETQEGLVDQLVQIKMMGLPDDYLHIYRERINAVSIGDIRRVAGEYVTPAKAALIVVGDAAEIIPQITPYTSDIEIYDTEGRIKNEAMPSESARA
jgi:zinc protease